MGNRGLCPYTADENISLVEVMKKIDENAKGILFILDGQERLLGSVTDGDVRRWLIKTGNLNAKAAQFMNSHPQYLYENDRQDAQKCMKASVITALPILSEDKKIVDIVFRTGSSIQTTPPTRKNLAGVPVVIMAGGKGTRLYPYTKILPKPLIPVGDVPIVERIIHRFCAFGCTDFYLIVNHKKSMIKAYFNEISAQDYNIRYAEESEPLGTGGGLSLLKGKIKNTFILSNCDILIEDNIDDIYAYHKEQNNVITMVCALQNFQLPYGVVHVGAGGTIERMEEKPDISYLTNTGFYIVEPEVIDSLENSVPISFPEIVEQQKEKGKNVGIYPVGMNTWYDMGQMETMERMEKHLGEII